MPAQWIFNALQRAVGIPDLDLGIGEGTLAGGQPLGLIRIMVEEGQIGAEHPNEELCGQRSTGAASARTSMARPEAMQNLLPEGNQAQATGTGAARIAVTVCIFSAGDVGAQIRVVRSLLAVASHIPSSEIATVFTAPPCPVRGGAEGAGGGVPDPGRPVVAGGGEPSAIRRDRDVAHSLVVADEGSAEGGEMLAWADLGDASALPGRLFGWIGGTGLLDGWPPGAGIDVPQDVAGLMTRLRRSTGLRPWTRWLGLASASMACGVRRRCPESEARPV